MQFVNHALGRDAVQHDAMSPPKHPKDHSDHPARQKISLSPKETCEALVESAVARHHQRIDVLFLKGLWGGILLSYGGFLEAVIGGSPSAMTNNPGLLRLVEGLVFPVGLMLIVLTGTELLTSDIMIILMGVLKRRIPWWSIPYNWITVFFGNLCGSLLFALFLVRWSDLASDAVRTFLLNTSETRVALGWGQVFCRGIGCNIMVCLAVYGAIQGSDIVSKIVAIYLILSAFVVIQYEHVVADMFTIPMGKMAGAPFAINRYIGTTMMGALVGNIVGGSLLAFSLYWMYLRESPQPARVTDDEKNPRDDSQETLNATHGAAPGGRGSHF